MNIEFVSVYIEGFQSIGKETINLRSLGTTLIKGKNLYEEFANSNGSGKSSIIESILYAIYGKTSSGISDVINKYYDNGCCIKLDFIIDNVSYTIIRSINHIEYKTGLKLLRNEEDISERNKTDTEKLILKTINISSDLFTSIIFLSQGFNSRFTLLSPSSKKDRIEKLSNIDEHISDFKSRLCNIRDEYKKEYNSINSELNQLIGKKSVIEKDCDNLEKIITKNSDIDLEDVPDINRLSDKLSKLEHVYNNLNFKSLNIRNDINNILNSKRSYESQILTLKDNIKNNTNKLLKLKDNVCYVCGHTLDEEYTKKEMDKIKNKLHEDKLKIIELNNNINNLDNEDDFKKNLEVIDSKKSSMIPQIKKLKEDIIKYREYKDVSNEKSLLVSKKSELLDVMNKIDTKNKELEIMSDRLSASEQCVSLVTKQFRNYLLKNVIEFINSKLKIYSSKLYSNNETIFIDDKFNVMLSDYNYFSLSGGERRKLDIALVFAQRDLALNVSNLNSNILVLDEIYDNLDDKAISVVSDMISDLSNNIDSTYIISHMNNVDLKCDNIMTVVKDKNRISYIDYNLF